MSESAKEVIEGWMRSFSFDQRISEMGDSEKKSVAEEACRTLEELRDADYSEGMRRLKSIDGSDMDESSKYLLYELVARVIFRWKDWTDPCQFQLVSRAIEGLVNGRLRFRETDAAAEEEEKKADRLAEEMIEEEEKEE